MMATMPAARRAVRIRAIGSTNTLYTLRYTDWKTVSGGGTQRTSGERRADPVGWAPRSNEECIVASAESLVALKLLKR